MQTPGMIKTRLLLKKAEIEARFGQAIKQRHGKDETANRETPEQSSKIANDEKMYPLEQEALAELVKINHALQRLEQGQYAQCSQCRLPISERRLQAFPATDLCYTCAKKI
ncbi:MAG: TraR/DksA C4-type zinc finger protein [Pseudomonadota bacterium]